MKAGATATTCDLFDLGTIGYAEADEIQRRLAADVADGDRGAALLLLEHPPVITLGRRSRESHVLLPRERLAALGVAVVDCDRGGDVTFHGPGQLVAYPILSLTREGLTAKGHVSRLEEVMIRVSASYGVSAGRVPGRTGAWVGPEKIGAVGVRLDRWITRHGFAYNVAVNLDYFQLIIPCGIADRGVTSLAKVLGSPPPMADAKARAAAAFGEVFGMEVRPRPWA